MTGPPQKTVAPLNDVFCHLRTYPNMKEFLNRISNSKLGRTFTALIPMVQYILSWTRLRCDCLVVEKIVDDTRINKFDDAEDLVALECECKDILH